MIRIAFFSTKQWVVKAFEAQIDQVTNKGRKQPDLQESQESQEISCTFLEPRLTKQTVSLAKDHQVVCLFVNDLADGPVLEELSRLGTKLIALRCAGYNNVDLRKAKELGIGVVRVPAYSPYSVAEHTIGLILSLNRRFHKAYARVRDGNFALDGLMGFDLKGKTVGVIGTGKIGQVFSSIMRGFGCKVLAYDLFPQKALEEQGLLTYVELDELYRQSHIISLHCPLTHQTYHIINEYAVAVMRPGVMIINTSRGPLIDTQAVIQGLKSGAIGALGLDVYEEEDDLFFEDLSEQGIPDDTFVRLLSFPNVLITGHQAFFTKEAIEQIAQVTLKNIREYFHSGTCANLVLPPEKGSNNS